MTELQTGSELVPAARQEGDAVVLAIKGEIDLHNSAELRTHVLDLMTRFSPKRLIFNLAQVPYMDSSAVAVLVEARGKMGRINGGKVVLTTLQPRVKSLLDIAKLSSIFTIAQDEAEAMTK